MLQEVRPTYELSTWQHKQNNDNQHLQILTSFVGTPGVLFNLGLI